MTMDQMLIFDGRTVKPAQPPLGATANSRVHYFSPTPGIFKPGG
ncbi:hypothetical protein [Aestuariivirga sp.]